MTLIRMVLESESWVDLVFYAVVILALWRPVRAILPTMTRGGLLGSVSAYIIGSGLNGIAVAFNGWRMPVLHANTCYATDGFTHISLTTQTVLPFLTDQIPIWAGSTTTWTVISSPGDLIVFSSWFLLALTFVIMLVQWAFILWRKVVDA